MTRPNVQKFNSPIKRFQDNLEGKEGQILLGAFQSIVEMGTASTTIRRIAAKAGVNPGIIHYYYRSKEDLVRRVLEICYQTSIDNIEAIFASELSPIEKIMALFDLGLSNLEYRRDEWIVITSFWAYSMSGHSDMLRLHQKLNRRFHAAMINLLKKSAGELRAETSKDIALLAIATLEGLALQYVLDPKDFEPEKTIRFLKELFLKARE